jgi:hypothetical protein
MEGTELSQQAGEPRDLRMMVRDRRLRSLVHLIRDPQRFTAGYTEHAEIC